MTARALLLALIVFLAAAGLVFASEQGWTHGLEGSAAEAMAPAQRAATGFAAFVESFLDVTFRVGTLEQENRRLRGEVARLNQETMRLLEAGQENERLRALLDYREANPGHEYQAAAIINREDVSNLVQAITIDRGQDDGVREGMIVVADGGLVGRVTKSYSSVAKVLLITDASSTANVMIQRTRAAGVLMGGVDRTLKIEYLNQDEDVQTGDLVVTSGLGGAFPKGIPVGKVSAVSGSDMALFKAVQVQPTVPFRAIEEVLVITDFTPQQLP